LAICLDVRLANDDVIRAPARLHQKRRGLGIFDQAVVAIIDSLWSPAIGLLKFFLPVLAVVHMPIAIADDSSSLSVDFAVRGIAQHGNYSNAFNDDQSKIDNRTQGATIADLDISYQPGRDDQFFVQVRYANGNGLNNTGGLSFAPYGGDLEDQVIDIGGRDRDYLREAWYRHDFRVGRASSLDLTAGLVDSANYIATNAYFGDEDAQFMNQIFSNNLTAQLPSYDPGGVIRLESGDWSLTGVYMTPKTDEGKTYDYYAAQLRLRRESALGPGHYNLFAIATSSKFQNAKETDDDASLKAVGLSFDQQLGPVLGVFAEMGFQDDEASIRVDRVLTVGVNVNGSMWSRPGDEIGIAFGRANGESGSSLDNSSVAEAYMRVRLSASSDISLDFQYAKDSLDSSGMLDDPELFVIGLRFNSRLGF
jgi:hypothetical protein